MKKKKMILNFFDYKNDEQVKPSYVELLKMSGFVNSLKETKYMSLLVKDD